MTNLMVYAGAGAHDAAVSRTGGIPLAPAAFSWPRCRSCGGNMQFLAQLMAQDVSQVVHEAAAGAAVTVFMCQNDPGMCDDWDATAGANQAFILPDTQLSPVPPPAEGETTLGEVSTIAVVTTADDDYDEAREHWPARTGRPGVDILGQLGGAPGWLQRDETPDCPTCRQPMTFTAQFEEGHQHRTAINFGGGGCGYLFTCWPCGRAAFLWQR